MFPRSIITLLCFVLLSMIIQDTTAYRLDQREVHSDKENDNSHLFEADFLDKLQNLLSAADSLIAKNKQSALNEHELQTRLAINRRPGLIRLKKASDN
ncbi:unnamed protein product [Adineta ricciae]|uniref:Secreted protein n=1 Tax=Adineta ricciae TaxID=249248 RepID=A0A815FEM4_ADIRI|nr:unnamed protein product [Adineta ricciae]CAF1324393.1 unnamed protein product [Adineta ricciae]